MTLDYTNPNDWGKSPLTDKALRMQQFKAENPEQWDSMIEADLASLRTPAITEITEESNPQNCQQRKPDA